MAPSFPDGYVYTHANPQAEIRRDEASPYSQMSQLAQRQQQHIEDLTKLLRKQTTRLNETKRELARQKEKRSSEKSDLKRLRRQVENQQCSSCKPTGSHRVRGEVVSSIRREGYQPREKETVYARNSYTRKEYNHHSPKYDKPHPGRRENSGRSSGRLPDRDELFTPYAEDPRVRRRKNNEHWKHGLSATRNCGFAQQGVSRELSEGYEVRREKGVVGRLGKGVREIPAGLMAAAARDRERRRPSGDRG